MQAPAPSIIVRGGRRPDGPAHTCAVMIGFRIVVYLPLSKAALSIAAILAMLCASTVRAADADKVEQLLRDGIALRRQGEDRGALPLFQEAYAIAKSPRTAAQLGLVEFAMGHTADAAVHLSDALSMPGDAWMRANRPILEQTLTRVSAKVGQIHVTGEPVGAEVLLDGKAAGRLPLAAPIRHDEGHATIELRADGYGVASSSVEIVGGKLFEVHLVLVRQPNVAAPAVTAPPAVAVVGTWGPPPGTTARGSSWPDRSVVGWSIGAAGIVSAAAGVALLIGTSNCVPRQGFQCMREPVSHAPAWTLVGAGVAAGIAGTITLVSRPTSRTEVGFGSPFIFLRVTR